MSIKIGDVVRLKSDGPYATVIEVQGDIIKIIYADDLNRMRDATVPVQAVDIEGPYI